MAKKYQVNMQVRIINRIMKILIRLGLMPAGMYLLTTRGRKSSKLYTTPVNLIIDDDRRWLVSPYGEVGWVHNARAAGQVTLSRGGKTEVVGVEELEPEEAAPISKAYLEQNSFPRQFVEIPYDAPLEEFVKIVPNHPVFRLVPQ